jgi:hypothetical protein
MGYCEGSWQPLAVLRGSNLHMLTSVKLFVDASEQLLRAAAAAAARLVEGQ